MRFHITVNQADERWVHRCGWIVVECPDLPGCVSQGRDEAEVRANIEETIRAWLWAEEQKAIMAGSAGEMA